MRHSPLRAFAAAALLTAMSFPAMAQAGPKGPTIVDVAAEANEPGGAFENQLNTLIAALQAADPTVLETLRGNGQFTVFAPTDGAFSNLGLTPDNVGDVPGLTEILLYHVAHGRRSAADVTTSDQIRTLQKGLLYVSGATLTDQVGRSANIIATDIEAANGVIHAIDEVVLPFSL
jgi:uncharacterized surface protein with fasciclin (FAS1) repeats